MWEELTLTLLVIGTQASHNNGVPVVAGPPPPPLAPHVPVQPPAAAVLPPPASVPVSKSIALGPPYPPQPVIEVQVPLPPHAPPPANPYDPRLPHPYQPSFSPHGRFSYYPRYDSSEEDDYGTCNSCHMVKSTCEDKPFGYDCRKPRVTYFSTATGCHRAVLTCKGANDRWTKIVTSSDKILTEGRGVAKMLKCREGKWRAYDIGGHEEKFRTARCLIERDRRPERDEVVS